MYGYIVTMMVGVHRMMPETVPPYLDESMLVPEQEVGGVKVGGDAPRPSVADCTVGLRVRLCRSRLVRAAGSPLALG